MYHLLKSIFKDWCEETNGIENARAGFGWFQTAKRDLRIILKWWNQEIMFVCLLAFLNWCTATKVKLKVVWTEQTDPQEERNANRYLFPPGDFARKRRKSCCDLSIQVFVLILIYYGSSPLVHLLIQSSHWVTATAHYCFKQSSPGLAGLGYFWDLVRFHRAHTGGERGKGCCWPLWKARWDGENYKPFKSVLNRNIKSLERAMKATRQSAMYL